MSAGARIVNGATIRVSVRPDGGRRVTVDVPVALCVAAVGFATGDPVAQADDVAQEIAADALAEATGIGRRA